MTRDCWSGSWSCNGANSYVESHSGCTLIMIIADCRINKSIYLAPGAAPGTRYPPGGAQKRNIMGEAGGNLRIATAQRIIFIDEQNKWSVIWVGYQLFRMTDNSWLRCNNPNLVIGSKDQCQAHKRSPRWILLWDVEKACLFGLAQCQRARSWKESRRPGL